MNYHVRRKLAHKHVDKKLRIRVQIYFIISIILIGVVLYEIAIGLVALPLALLGVVIGIFLGFITARMFHLSWGHDTRQIISRLDLFGGLILVLYIILAIFRRTIVEHFIHGSAVGGVSISIVTGIMVGRALGTRGRIIQILKEQKVFS